MFFNNSSPLYCSFLNNGDCPVSRALAGGDPVAYNMEVPRGRRQRESAGVRPAHRWVDAAVNPAAPGDAAAPPQEQPDKEIRAKGPMTDGTSGISTATRCSLPTATISANCAATTG